MRIVKWRPRVVSIELTRAYLPGRGQELLLVTFTTKTNAHVSRSARSC